jgi:hypothetical protein
MRSEPCRLMRLLSLQADDSAEQAGGNELDEYMY